MTKRDFVATGLSTLLFLFFFESFPCSCNAELKEGILYRIRNGYDGNVLTSHEAYFASDLSLKLGKVTTEEWYSGKNQIWTVEKRPSSQENNEEGLFLMKPKSAVLNELTGIPKDAEKHFKIKEIAQTSGSFVIQNLKTGLCLENKEFEQSISYKVCNELSPSQQWDFEDIGYQKFTFLINRIKLS